MLWFLGGFFCMVFMLLRSDRDHKVQLYALTWQWSEENRVHRLRDEKQGSCSFCLPLPTISCWSVVCSLLLLCLCEVFWKWAFIPSCCWSTCTLANDPLVTLQLYYSHGTCWFCPAILQSDRSVCQPGPNVTAELSALVSLSFLFLICVLPVLQLHILAWSLLCPSSSPSVLQPATQRRSTPTSHQIIRNYITAFLLLWVENNNTTVTSLCCLHYQNK